MSTGLTKIIRLDERFPGTGEPTMRILRPSDMYGVKLASEAGEYIKSVKPVHGKTIVLVLAMSAGEYYGPNRNGDAFSERPVSGKVAKGETLPDHHGRFETNAHVFRHHQNKDPATSFGRIVKSFYNWDMHRVELLLELDNEKGRDVVEKIERGEYPAVSMGCKIKYDVCDKCGNRAPTRAQYCDHLKYEMNRVYPDGTKSFCWNPAPDLFDISFVIRPADRVGFMMKKVAYAEEALTGSAELGEKVADFQEKMSTLKKLSDMDKVIRGQAVDHEPKGGPLAQFRSGLLPNVMAHSPAFDQSAINDLAQHPLPVALSTLGAMGITPTGSEITRMMMQRACPGQQLPPRVELRISASAPDIMELMQKLPELLQSVLGSGFLDVGPEKVNPQLAQKLGHWMEKRSNFREYLWRRAAPITGEPHASTGNYDTVNVNMPNGHQYQTTQGAMDAADDANINQQLKMMAGVGLATGAGYKVLSAHPTGKYMAPLALAGGAMGLYNTAKRYDAPSVKREGVAYEDRTINNSTLSGDVPLNTELQKVGSDALPLLVPAASSAALTAILAQEYNKKRETGELGLGNPITEGVGEVAFNHPVATTVGGLGLAGVGMNAFKRLLKHGSEDLDGVKLAEIDLAEALQLLGEILYR